MSSSRWRRPGAPSIRAAATAAGALGLAAAALVTPSGAAGAATAGRALVPAPFLYVGGGGCSDTGTGAGTQVRPYCTIMAAAKVAVAGQTVLVASGAYPEEVFPWHSGTAGSPIRYQPAPGATVQVVGARHGFTISNQSWITVTGFTISGTTSNGVYVYNATGITLSGNTVRGSGQRVSGATAYGMYLNAMTGSLVTGNLVTDNSASGIYLTGGATGNRVTGNESSFNAYGYVRNAVGIDLRAPGNVVEGNRVHDNEDSGIQSYPGGNDNLIVDNIAYHSKGFTSVRLSNCSAPPTGNTAGCITGDHGIDNFAVTGNHVIGNDVYDNVAAGINLEGLPSGTPSGFVFANNIAVDNALSCPDGAGGTVKCPRTRGNIRVDSTSQLGTTLDHDLVALVAPGVAGTTSTMMVWGSTSYASLSAFRTASGQEVHALQGDPLWTNPGAGDFTLRAASPAIDSADSDAPGQTAVDALGRPRADDPAVADTGVGRRSYDDLGALERQPTALAPTRSATPSTTGPVALPITPLTASARASCPSVHPLVSVVDSATSSPPSRATLGSLQARSTALARTALTVDVREQVQGLADDLRAYGAATVVSSAARSAELRTMVRDHLASLRRVCGW